MNELKKHHRGIEMKNPHKCLNHDTIREIAFKHDLVSKGYVGIPQNVYNFVDEVQTISHPEIIFGYGRVHIANTTEAELPKIIIIDHHGEPLGVGKIYENNFPESKPPVEDILVSLCFHNIASLDALLSELHKLKENMLAGKYDAILQEKGLNPINQETE